jgi:hypothetical protein
MAFGAMFTPRDLRVIAHACVKAARHEPDMLKRRELIGVITKLQRSIKSRRARAETRAVKARLARRKAA